MNYAPASSTRPSWWTNKLLIWIAFWTWLFGVTGVFLEEKKEFDRDAIYQVDTYRGRIHSGRRIEGGDSLATREETRIIVIRILGFACLAAAIPSTTVIFQRLGRGEPVFCDAF